MQEKAMADASRQLEEIQRRIMAREFSSALQALDSLISTGQSVPEALYMKAVCHRYCDQIELALLAIKQLKELSPDHGRAHQEEGHSYRAIGQWERAVHAYERAYHYNRALEASLRAQLDLLRSANQTERAQQVQTRLDKFMALPKPLVSVMDLVSQGKLLKAEEHCRRFMLQVPHHAEGMRVLADIGVRLGALDDAEFLLETALVLKPASPEIRIDYIRTLRKRQKYVLALGEAQTLLKSDPDNPMYRSIYAIECMQTGDFDKALDAFNEVLELLPADPVTLTSKGHALKTKGDTEDAIASYHRAIGAHRAHGEAYYSLANLKTYRFSVNEMEAMTELVKDSDLAFMDRVYLNFALGKAHEDAKQYSESFNYYKQGNALKKSQSRYRAEQMSEELQAQKQFFSTQFFAQAGSTGVSASDPIFILGLPRSGSTLLEQILSSHSQIDGTLELPNILSLSQRLRRLSIDAQKPGYPQVLLGLSREKLVEYGQAYIEETRIHRQGAPLFIDKMPNNFRHIGLIKLILPNAKIIDARRNPLDCSFSCFKQLFAEGQEFTYDLQDIGQYYRDYLDLMRHWDDVLPGFVLRVNNEDVIDDLEGQVQRMLDFCGLPFEEACLNFHRTKRNVRTPSAEQVRQPVSREGVEKWKAFEEYLAPLKDTLGPEILSRYAGVVA